MTQFLFGAATSAHQVEGDNRHSDWWAFEEKVLSEKGIQSGKAANHWELFEEDFALAKQLGHNSHRLSLEWAKIEPEEGKIDFKAIEHYHKVFEAMKKYNLTPIVTLWHFTLPNWFARKGGFMRKRNIQTFIDYVKFITAEFKDEFEYIITINEPIVYAYQSYLAGNWPPQKKKMRTFFKITNNLAHMHNRLYRVLKKRNPNFKISIAKNNQVFEPLRKYNIFDRAIAKYFEYTWNHRFLNLTKHHLDFIGINYYFYRAIKFSKALAKSFYSFPYPTCRKTDMDWEVYPKGIYITVKDVYERYKLPIIITENGVADSQDHLRKSMIKETLNWLFKAKGDGIDIRGYLHWSLLDNFEWDSGFTPEFGLIKVDYKNFARSIRPSALLYQDLIKDYQEQMKGNNSRPK